MDTFQRKIDFSFKTNQKILNLIGSIDSFKGKWSNLEKKESVYLKELRNISTIKSTGASTRIEGSSLADSEIKKLLNNIQISKLKTRDQQEVVGYYEVLEIIIESYSDIKISKNYIQQFHQKLLGHSTKDESHRGYYKNTSNKVVATYPDGTQKTIFNTTQPHLVESEMALLFDWTDTQFELAEIHPLVVIALFVYEFLSIHPFTDGNGRLARLLTTLLLLKKEYVFVKYISFESLIEQKKRSYYQALMAGQKNRYLPSETIDKWVLFFLNCLKTLIGRFETEFNAFKTKGGYLSDRQKRILEFIKKEQPIKLSDLSKAFAKVSIHTLKKDLQYLKREQFIESIGKNKGTFYLERTKG